MFAAIALVVFSGAAIADSGEMGTNNINKLLTPTDLCVTAGFAASDKVYADGGTPEQARDAAEKAYNDCKSLDSGTN